jgi:hypothetical protein
MITFKQFLSESDIEAISAEVMLRKDCDPFLYETMGSFLVRGVQGLTLDHMALDPDGNKMEFGIKNVRTDRRPLDTSERRHKIFDEWFERKFGWKPRSEGVFAFGEKASISEIKTYGKPCIIFPIGPIKYVWSPRVSDLYADIIYSGIKDKDDDSIEDRILEWLDHAGYIDQGLEDAALGNSEVMIKCSRYYAFPYEYMKQLQYTLK